MFIGLEWNGCVDTQVVVPCGIDIDVEMLMRTMIVVFEVSFALKGLPASHTTSFYP
ncbi:MAG: hypothetical protein NPIRA06_25360 [Nitrospirales bacterium]|nr:MAG: hypothetical protein NPIRA06_25360 [Nitrospirales bacterium]